MPADFEPSAELVRQLSDASIDIVRQIQECTSAEEILEHAVSVRNLEAAFENVFAAPINEALIRQQRIIVGTRRGQG